MPRLVKPLLLLAVLAIFAFPARLAAQEKGEAPADVAGLIAELGSESWEVRERAQQALAAMGDSIAGDLRKALAETKDMEIRIRLEALLENVERREAAEKIEVERAVNVSLYEKRKETLWKENKGKWFVIAGGEIFGPFIDFETALAGCAERTRKAVHRFVFQAGMEVLQDREPRMHGSLRSGDLGSGFRPGMGITVMGGKAFVVDPDRGLVPLSPGRYTVPGAAEPEIETPVFYNTGFAGQVCLDPESALRLGLHRFEIPGVIEGGTLDSGERPGKMLLYPARRAWVMVRFGNLTEKARMEALLPREPDPK